MPITPDVVDFDGVVSAEISEAAQLEVPFVFSKFNRPVDPGLAFDPSESDVQQSFKDECDINRIVSQYTKTGTWSGSLRPPTLQPHFGDFSNVLDYQESLNRIIEAQAAFDALPARVRERFQNDPVKLLAFLDDEGNLDEAIKLGLAVKKEPSPSATDPLPAPAGDPKAAPAPSPAGS